MDEKTLELSIHSEHSFLYKMCEREVNLNRLQQRKKRFLRFVLLSNKNKSLFKIGFQWRLATSSKYPFYFHKDYENVRILEDHSVVNKNWYENMFCKIQDKISQIEFSNKKIHFSNFVLQSNADFHMWRNHYIIKLALKHTNKWLEKSSISITCIKSNKGD